MAVPKVVGLYPFSTKQGQVIPLDIISSKSLILVLFKASSSTNISIPASSSVALVYASEECLISPSTDLVLGYSTPLEDAIFIPRQHVVACTIQPGNLTVLGLETAGRLVVQIIDQWAGLGLEQNYSRRG